MKVTGENVPKGYQVKCRECGQPFESVVKASRHECGQPVKEIPEPLEPIVGDDVYDPHAHWSKFWKRSESSF